MKPIDYAAPRTLSEATGLLGQHGDRARVLAGGTDIIVQVREGRKDIDLLVDVKRIPELNQLQLDSHGLTIGAAVPCCLIYENAAIARAYPGLIDAAALIGGIQIQSRATLGGNLCNASPAADSIPPLIVHRAVCVIAGPHGTRELPVENFCTAPGKTALQPNELLVCLKLPAPAARFGAGYLRFIPRNEMDIAVAGAAVSLELDDSKQRCTEAHVALAAVAPTPLYVPAAGAALVDGAVNDALIDKVAAAAQEAARPISDMRGDADYRKHLVGVLTKRALRMALERAQA
ncbi:MAG: xanthine dehydrogenase family protein subunit M [Gemmataceae bacterium]